MCYFQNSRLSEPGSTLMQRTVFTMQLWISWGEDGLPPNLLFAASDIKRIAWLSFDDDMGTAPDYIFPDARRTLQSFRLLAHAVTLAIILRCFTASGRVIIINLRMLSNSTRIEGMEISKHIENLCTGNGKHRL